MNIKIDGNRTEVEKFFRTMERIFQSCEIYMSGEYRNGEYQVEAYIQGDFNHITVGVGNYSFDLRDVVYAREDENTFTLTGKNYDIYGVPNNYEGYHYVIPLKKGLDINDS